MKYGYLDVAHVADSVVVNIRVRLPVWRTWISVEELYQVVDVSHVASAIIDSYCWTGNIAWNANVNLDR